MTTYTPHTTYRHAPISSDPWAVPIYTLRTVAKLPSDYANHAVRSRLH